ncbi:MAG: DUF262 domain-containing HNH endonuclease family protein [Erysipelotrichales bacterium]|nr:DUF262 domain-containing HNH endonuclease family protein [Erysipelotrichales bacterium]
MKAEPEKIIDLMFDNKRQYQIPVYQRDYDWKSDNCKELFVDVIQAYKKEKTHFFGTIVQVQQDEENSIKRFLIVDGQQRMTSVYLLLKALYDLDNGSNEDKLEKLLYNFSGAKTFSIDEKNKLKLKPIKSDNVQFVKLMTNDLDGIDKSSNIYLNYAYFKKLISEHLNEDIEISNILKGLEYLQIVMISLKEEAGDEPQVVFERINSTGEDLTLSDLIRNYVLMTDKNQDELFEKYWTVIAKNIGDKEKMSDFFITFLHYKTQESININNAYSVFKKIIESKSISNEEILKEFVRFSRYYEVLIKSVGEDNPLNIFNPILSGFRDLKQSTIFPFLFALFNDYENEVIDKICLQNSLSIFLNYTLRRAITGVPTNSFRGLYLTLYKRIFETKNKENYLESIYRFLANLKKTKDAVPSDNVLLDSLMNSNIYKDRKTASYILSLLENSNYKEKVILTNITIEHIMPQNKTDEWRAMIGENYDFVYDKYLHTLGNLTLTGFNSELSDKSYAKKRDFINYNTKFVILNEEFRSHSMWNEGSITSRAKRLGQRLVEILELPDIIKNSYVIDNSMNKFSLLDRGSHSGSKPINLVILGETITISSWKELLSETLNFLYNEYESIILENLAKEKFKLSLYRIYLTFDSTELRNPRKIENSNIYYETNLSANNILSFIRAVLDKYDIPHSDVMFYTKEDLSEVELIDNECAIG